MLQNKNSNSRETTVKHITSDLFQDGGSLDQVLKEARRIPEEILGKVSIAVSITLFRYLLTTPKVT